MYQVATMSLSNQKSDESVNNTQSEDAIAKENIKKKRKQLPIYYFPEKESAQDQALRLFTYGENVDFYEE